MADVDARTNPLAITYFVEEFNESGHFQPDSILNEDQRPFSCLLQTLVKDTDLPHIVLETPRYIRLVVNDHSPDTRSTATGECDDLIQRSGIEQVEMARQMNRAGPRGLPWVEGHGMIQDSRGLRVELWPQVGCMESLLGQPKQALISQDLAVEHRME